MEIAQPECQKANWHLIRQYLVLCLLLFITGCCLLWRLTLVLLSFKHETQTFTQLQSRNQALQTFIKKKYSNWSSSSLLGMQLVICVMARWSSSTQKKNRNLSNIVSTEYDIKPQVSKPLPAHEQNHLHAALYDIVTRKLQYLKTVRSFWVINDCKCMNVKHNCLSSPVFR